MSGVRSIPLSFPAKIDASSRSRRVRPDDISGERRICSFWRWWRRRRDFSDSLQYRRTLYCFATRVEPGPGTMSSFRSETMGILLPAVACSAALLSEISCLAPLSLMCWIISALSRSTRMTASHNQASIFGTIPDIGFDKIVVISRLIESRGFEDTPRPERRTLVLKTA